MPKKLSVIITADGCLKELNRSLDSICGQNILELQVICVNNGFDDLSLTRIERYSQLYDFVTMIECSKNTSKIDAFRIGLAHSTGEYTLFLDGNMFFETRAFETFLSMAYESTADIFHFGITLYPKDDVSVPYLHLLERAKKVCYGILTADTLLYYAYVEQKFSTGLHDKLIKTDILRSSINDTASSLPDKYGEEVLMYKVLRHSKSYRGETSKVFVKCIIYAEKNVWLTLDDFETVVSHVKWLDEIPYSENLETSCDKPINIIKCIRLNMLKNALMLWNSTRLTDTDKPAALRILKKYWGADAILCGLAEWHNNSKESYAHFLANEFDASTDNSHNAVAIFIYEESDLNIGKELQADIGLIDSSYVVPPSDLGFPFINIETQTIENAPQLHYQSRLNAIHNAVQDKHIGICLLPRCSLLYFWDILALKLCGIKVCIYAKNTSNLSSTARKYYTANYWRNLIILMQSDAAILPDNTDLTMFYQLGINPVNEPVCKSKMQESIKMHTKKSNGLETVLYEQSILKEIYQQEKNILKNEQKRLKIVLGPLWSVMFRPINATYIRKGIKLGLLREMFLNASLLGKTKLLCKILMKLTGIKASLGIESYRPIKKKPLKLKLLFFKNKLHKLLSHPVESRKKFVTWQNNRKLKEKHLCLGNLNPDKIFYLIRINPGSEGILATYLYFLRQLKKLEKSNYIPVIDMQWAFYLNAHNNPKDKGKINAWEMYFKPVAAYPLSVAYKSQNVIRGKAGYRQQEDRYFSQYCLRENTEESEKDFAEWCRIDQKYMHLTDKLSEYFQKEFESLIGNSRVIGVMIREGYTILNNLNYELIGNHPKQPSIAQVVSDLKIFLHKWNCDKIYVSAEYQQTVDILREAFGNKMICTERFRKNFDAENPTEYQKRRESYYKQILREQINIDYLKEVYFLSRCTCLLAGRSNAVLVAALWNNGQYEHRKIYDLGTYSVDTTKRVVSLNEKQ